MGLPVCAGGEGWDIYLMGVIDPGRCIIRSADGQILNTAHPNWPMCYVCKHPVTEVWWWDCLDTNERIFRVRCHNAEEEVRVPWAVFRDILLGGSMDAIQFTEAFKPKAMLSE